MKLSVTNPIVKSTIGLFVMTMVLKIAGYGEKLVLAYYFGTNDSADAYILVLTIILSFFFFFREVIEPGVLNLFMRSEASEAWNIFNYVLRALFFVTAAIVLAGTIFPGNVITIFAPGFEGETRTVSVNLFQIAVPAVIFFSLSTITNIVLNAQKVFVFPIGGDVAFKLITIVCIIIFAREFGIVSAAWGILLGAIAKLGIHLTILRDKISFSNISVSRANKRELWILTWPLIIGMLFSQLTSVIDNVFSSYMEKGSIAALSYARKIIDLPIMIFPYILSVVVFPYFTQLSIQGDYQKSFLLLTQSLRWVVIAFIPLTIYFVFFSRQIVEVIFERGAFDEHSTMLTAGPLMIYSAGLLFFAIESILVIFYYSNSDTKTPIAVGIFCTLVNILLTYILISYIGYLAIALAVVVQKVLKICVLAVFLNKKIPLQFERILGFAGRVAVPIILFTFSLAALNFLFLATTDVSFIKKILSLGGCLVIASAIYICSLFLFGVLRVIDLPKLYNR